ncbi:hypothetical protein KXV85_001815, partial [Aspergillus fumigatus]
ARGPPLHHTGRQQRRSGCRHPARDRAGAELSQANGRFGLAGRGDVADGGHSLAGYAGSDRDESRHGGGPQPARL